MRCHVRRVVIAGAVVMGGLPAPASAGGTDLGCNAADIAPPYGVLDLQDIGAFINGFLNFDPIADVNHDGILDLLDVSLFISAFVNGCPTIECIPDIRSVVDGADLDPPSIQHNYDGINVTLHLIGGLTFADLFMQTPAQLFPIIDAQLDTLNDCVPGNTIDPEAIRTEIVQMSLQPAQMPLGQILTFGPGSEPFWGNIGNLRAMGMGIPDEPSGPTEIDARQAAFASVVEWGAAITAPMLFFQTKMEQPLDVLAGIEQAHLSGLLAASICGNDRCCSSGTGPIGTDECHTSSKWCNLPPPDRAFCSIASDPCP
ncbi:MAG: hypothetical protein H6810_06065 [Phycisphaeraceae bacterium]|nr:MAG: hypothetical protein H6810_06065 [Phycisphaeraceae bacterium]